jgi:uncharacterized membrane protein YcfT
MAPVRVDWVDYGKGICILLVVMWHSTLGVEAAGGGQGFMHALVHYATPFRMPDFFLISGLFLSRVIDRDWRTYLDRRVVHFAYFYVLWLTIQFAFKAPGFAAEAGWLGAAKLYALAFIDPFGMLWFIYLLPVFAVVVKLVRKVSPLIVWPIAAALEIAHVQTDWTLPLEFAQRFVYFYTGYLAATHVFRFASAVQERPGLSVAALVAWALINGALVQLGWSKLPFVSLALGFAGALAVVAMAALLAKFEWATFLRYCGEKSLQIYLAFFLPMVVTRVALLKTGIVTDPGLIALIVATSALIGALVMYWVARDTRLLGWLFARPQWARLEQKPKYALQPAE